MPDMRMGDRLSGIAIGVGIIVAVSNGTCSTNQRFADMRQTMENMQRAMESGFADAAEQHREAAAQRRNEHDQIIRRLERLEDLHIKPADGQ